MATLTVPAGVPPVAEDCEQLRKAFAGWGTNEKLIISILAHRDAAQRRAIRAAYAEAYGEELLRALNHEIHGKFEVRNTRSRPRPALCCVYIHPDPSALSIDLSFFLAACVSDPVRVTPNRGR